MDVRPSGGQADDDFCLGAVDSANRAALDAQKSQDGVCVLGAKISLGEAPLVCQLLSSSLANFGPTNNFVRGSMSFMETTLDSYSGDLARPGNCVYANGSRAVNQSMNERTATPRTVADRGVPLPLDGRPTRPLLDARSVGSVG